MSKKERQADKLAEVSIATMTADNPKATLDSLGNTLSKAYQPAVAALQKLLTGESFPKIAKYTPWQGLKHLADSHQHPLSDYLAQYRTAHRAQFDLKNATGEYPPAFNHFAMILGGLPAFYWAFTYRVTPAIVNFFAEFDKTAPFLTRFIADGHYAVPAVIALLLTLLLTVFFPKQLAKAASGLSPLPSYWQKIPIYRTIARHYQHYLWLSYARLKLEKGEQHPLQNLPVQSPNLNADQRILWKIAWENGAENLAERLAQAQQNALHNYQQALQKAKQQLQTALMLIIALLVGVAVMAVYLPIFQLGEIIR